MLIIATHKGGKIHSSTLACLLGLPKTFNVVYAEEHELDNLFAYVQVPTVWIGYGCSCDIKQLIQKSARDVNVVPMPHSVLINKNEVPTIKWDVEGIRVKLKPALWVLRKKPLHVDTIERVFTVTQPHIVKGIKEQRYLVSKICQ